MILKFQYYQMYIYISSSFFWFSTLDSAVGQQGFEMTFASFRKQYQICSIKGHTVGQIQKKKIKKQEAHGPHRSPE
jgi:hypothetical protein